MEVESDTFIVDCTWNLRHKVFFDIYATKKITIGGRRIWNQCDYDSVNVVEEHIVMFVDTSEVKNFRPKNTYLKLTCKMTEKTFADLNETC